MGDPVSLAPTARRRHLAVPKYRLALDLPHFPGSEAGARRSAANVAKQLSPLTQLRPVGGPVVRAVVARFGALGFAPIVPGARADWVLTPQGADLVLALQDWKRPSHRGAARRRGRR